MAACGVLHTLAVSEDGVLYACGDGSRGALGLGNEERMLCPARVAVPHECVVVAASCGESHGACCTEDGRVYCWGDNTYAQGGHGDTESRLLPTLVDGIDGTILHVCCGRFHTAAVTATGRLYTWGRGGHGRLGHGDGDTDGAIVPKQIRPERFVDAIGQFPKVLMAALGAVSRVSGCLMCSMFDASNI